MRASRPHSSDPSRTRQSASLNAARACDAPPSWLMSPNRDALMPPEHLYTNPKGRSARGTLVPKLSLDRLQEIMYQFYDLCEPMEFTASRKKVEAKIIEMFAWSQVRQGHWNIYFSLFKRDAKDSYSLPEFLALQQAVDSGEFFSSDEPDGYAEPEKWVRNEEGRLTPRKPKYEPILISPRSRCPPSAFKDCLGQLLHHCGLDDPRLLYRRLSQSGKPISLSFFEFFNSTDPSRDGSHKKGTTSHLTLKKIKTHKRPMSSPGMNTMSSGLSQSFPYNNQHGTPASRPSGSWLSNTGESFAPEDSMPWQSPGFTWRFRNIQKQGPARPSTGYDTEESSFNSWDLQNRCQCTLEARGELDQELIKIFRYYFPDAQRPPARRRGFCSTLGSSERQDSGAVSADLLSRPPTAEGYASGDERLGLDGRFNGPQTCSLEGYWNFWRRVGFFEGPFKDSPAYYINKSFAVGGDMNTLFRKFVLEASTGRQFKLSEKETELSFQGWMKALEELSCLLFLGSLPDRSACWKKFLTQVILPSCHRPNPNPVYMHFRRTEVLNQLERYANPLRKMFQFFVGTAPAPNILMNMMPKEAPVNYEAKANDSTAGGGNDPVGGNAEALNNQAINVEEFLLFCKCMDLCPSKIDEISLRYIFVRSNFGLDSDMNVNMLDFDEFVECLCRIALICFGKKVLEGCDPGQTGEVACLFLRDQKAVVGQNAYSQSSIQKLFGGEKLLSFAVEVSLTSLHAVGTNDKKGPQAMYQASKEGKLVPNPFMVKQHKPPSGSWQGREEPLAGGTRRGGKEHPWILDNAWVLNPSAVRFGSWAQSRRS